MVARQRPPAWWIPPTSPSLPTARSTSPTPAQPHSLNPGLPGYNAQDILIPSADGSTVDVFSPAGQQLKTIDALTGATLESFAYDAQGRLSSVTDGSGNVTTILRDASGNPTAIVSPYGQMTTLTVDANGYLASITDPAGNTTRLTTTASGLLTSYTDADDQVHTFSYDAQGRLTEDTEPNGAFTALSRTGTNNDYTVTAMMSGMMTSTYEVDRLPTGDLKLVETDANMHVTTTLVSQNGTTTVTAADGSVTTETLGPDPRFGMLAPIPQSITTPGGSGSTSKTTTTRVDTFAVAGDASSAVATQTDTVVVNRQTYTTVYYAANQTVTVTTPRGGRPSRRWTNSAA